MATSVSRQPRQTGPTPPALAASVPTHGAAQTNTLDKSYVYAGYDMVPYDRPSNATAAQGQYTNPSPFDGGQVYVIAHAMVGIPDLDFGP